MKKICVLTLLQMLFVFAFSQKTDIEKLKITYVQFPEKPLEKTVKRYDVKVINKTNLELPPKETLLNYLKIEGFEISPDNPDVILFVVIDEIKTDSYVTSKVGLLGGPPQYFYKGDATLGVKVSFVTPDKQFQYYETNQFGPVDALTVSEECLARFQNENDAKVALNNDKSLLDRVTKASVGHSLKSIGVYLNKSHGYSTISEYFPVWTIRSKSFDYAELDQAKDKYTQAVTQYTKEGMKEENKKLLQEAIAIWEKNIAEYKPDDKNARISEKNILELYVNLVLANIWAENYDDAKKYLALAQKEKGLNQWKGVIADLLTTSEKGYGQNLLREQNQLNIVKSESDFFAAPDFIITGNTYRIKYKEYYDELRPKNLQYREVFNYDQDGLLTKVYRQQYSSSNNTFTGESDSYSLKYDNKNRTISIVKGTNAVPVITRKISSQKIIHEQTKDQYRTTESDFTYDKNGKTLGYVKSSGKTAGTTIAISYDQDRVKDYIDRSWSVNGRDTTWQNRKCSYLWEGKTLKNVDIYFIRSPSKDFTKAYSMIYTYDGKGRITKVADGAQAFNYRYDDNGNMIDLVINSDSTPEHYSYVWEAGTGNASLYLSNADNPRSNPLFYPQVH